MSGVTKKKASASSASRELIKVGPKDVKISKNGSKKDKDGRRPTTSAALVLRSGKYGSFGTGEMVLATKLSGREKLDLLAEDYTEKAKKAVATPFNLDKCLSIADAQYNAYLDDIANLQDPELFFNKVASEVGARTPPKNGKRMPPALNKPDVVASTIATKIHNGYMLASAWKLVLDSLGELRVDGLESRTASTSLKNDEDFRSRYLVLYDMVSKLVEIGQNKFSVLATTTPHYAQYFKPVEGAAPDEPDTVFDRDALKFACKSFLDSIIIELSFPEAPYPKRVLYQILHEAIDECPREAKRFPQELWNAVGDLSVTLELQELLEQPLLARGAAEWRDQPREMPEEYEKWVDAQIISEEASKHFSNYKNIINPLTKSRDKKVLDDMWKCVNLNYKSLTNGEDIDTLWQLEGALERTPQWHSVYVPALAEADEDSDSTPGLIAVRGKGAPKGGKRSGKKLLALTDGTADDSNDSMPELQSVSDSSESEEDDSDSDDDSNTTESDDEDSDAGYDTDEEDELREMMKEAMNAAMENPDFFDPKADPKDFQVFNEIAEERKGNPFLKLLGSLRGRVFKSSPKLKTTTRTATRGGFSAGRPTPPKPSTKTAKTTDDLSSVEPVRPKAKVEAPGSKTQKVTVEEVEDEDAVPAAGKKKKKKKPKKKKKSIGPDDVISPVQSQSPEPVEPPQPATIVTSPTKLSPKKQTAAPKSPPPRPPSFTPSSTTTLPHSSTTSLSFEQTTAQSARSYVKDLEGPKTKIKSRPGHASGFFSKFTRKDQPAESDPPKKGGKRSWFNHLSKKTDKLMHQLLNTPESGTQGLASMKWDNFVKLMKDMGFQYEPSTAGSSVRFDPPGAKDPPITFHKPHPDPTINPIMLREFSKRLQKTYGWTTEDFLKSSAL